MMLYDHLKGLNMRSIILFCLAACTSESTSAHPIAQTSAVVPGAVKHVGVLSGALSGGSFQTLNGTLTGNWKPTASGDSLAVALPVVEGEHIAAVGAKFYGDTGARISMTLMRQDDAFHVAGSISASKETALVNDTQELLVSEDSLGTPLNSETIGNAQYFVELTCLGTPTGAGPFASDVKFIVQ
jgi:hypothetical protein